MTSALPARSGRRWLAGVALVGVGWLLSPDAVPIYDGIGQPDEPYRYVNTPAGATKTLDPTDATTDTPVVAGRNRNGMSVQTKEQGPQMSVYLPPGALATTDRSITVSIAPEAPGTSPPQTRIDGNMYLVTMKTPSGAPITLTDRATVATLYLRATSTRKPQPTMYYRATATDPWRALPTSAGGFDVRVASFLGAGEYVVAGAPEKTEGKGTPLLPFVLLGSLVVVVAIILAIRLRATSDPAGIPG